MMALKRRVGKPTARARQLLAEAADDYAKWNDPKAVKERQERAAEIEARWPLPEPSAGPDGR